MENIEIPELGFIQAERDFSTICNAMKFDKNEILSTRRQAGLVEKRRVVAKALKAKGYSYPKIGHAMNRDHTSIMNLINPKKGKKQ